MGYNPYKIKKIRNLYLVLLILHLALLLERLVFDALGGIYLLVALNGLTIIFIVVAVIGAMRYHVKTIVFFMTWMVFWIAFNTLVICLYMNVGGITHEDKWLSLEEDSKSWFDGNGFGCGHNMTRVNSKNEVVKCVLQYEHIEVIQCVIHILLALVNFCVPVWLLVKLKEERSEEQFGFVGGFDMKTCTPVTSSHPKIKYLEDDIGELD